MNESEPIGVDGSKRHVSPHVARSNYVRGEKKGKKDHENGVGDASVECVEEFGVGEFMVRFMGETVDFGMSDMFEFVHEKLEEVLSEEAESDVGILDGALEGVVGWGEEVPEPGEGEVGSEEEESAGLGKMMEEGAGVDVGRSAAGLDGGGGA